MGKTAKLLRCEQISLSLLPGIPGIKKHLVISAPIIFISTYATLEML